MRAHLSCSKTAKIQRKCKKRLKFRLEFDVIIIVSAEMIRKLAGKEFWHCSEHYEKCPEVRVLLKKFRGRTPAEHPLIRGPWPLAINQTVALNFTFRRACNICMYVVCIVVHRIHPSSLKLQIAISISMNVIYIRSTVHAYCTSARRVYPSRPHQLAGQWYCGRGERDTAANTHYQS